jgi:hypothetical protein
VKPAIGSWDAAAAGAVVTVAASAIPETTASTSRRRGDGLLMEFPLPRLTAADRIGERRRGAVRPLDV